MVHDGTEAQKVLRQYEGVGNCSYGVLYTSVYNVA